MAALSAVVVFAVAGVLKFYSITLNIKQEIQDKEAALSSELDRQKKDIDAFQKSQKVETDGISSQLSSLKSSLASSKQQLDQVDIETQGALARFTMQAGRRFNDAVEVAVEKTNSDLDQRRGKTADRINDYWSKEAQPALKNAADKRVAEILADGWKPFQDKLREFDVRINNASEKMSKLEGEQGTVEGKQELLNKAIPLLSNPSPGIAERLSVYIGQALWVIYGGAILMLILTAVTATALIEVWRCRRQLGRLGVRTR
jgi:hypothetical protein